MHFEALNIAKYGKFRDTSLDGLGPFTIVHGPNEAGKSTLRHLLRDMLFGFPVARTAHPYGFDGMDARAKVRLSDNTCLTVHRKRSTSRFVEFPDSKMTCDVWSALLGGLDESLYARMLCCSGLEMDNTADALKKGEFLKTVHRDIAGGLRDDKALLDDLGLKVREFRVGQGVHRKYKELEQLQEQVSQASLGWKDMSSKTMELQRLERDHEEARAHNREKESKKAWAGSIVDLSATIEERERLENLLRSSCAPMDFPPRAREIWTSLSSRRREQNARLATLEDQIEALITELSGIATANPLLLESGPVLQPLAGSRGSIEKILRNLPTDRIKLAAIRTDIETLLAEHMPSVTLDAWFESGFHEASRKDLSAAWAAVETCRSELQRAVADVNANRKTLETLRPPESGSEKDRHLAGLWDSESSRVIMATTDQTKAASMIETGEQAFRRHRSKVALAGLPDLVSLMAMQLPQEQDVRRLASTWIIAHDATSMNHHEQDKLRSELDDLTHSGNEEPVTPERRDQLRLHRNLCWSAIRARFVDRIPDLATETTLGIQDHRSLAHDFELSLADSDAAADRLLERDHRDIRIADLQSGIAELQRGSCELQERENQALLAWNALWISARFCPGSNPQSGLEWFINRQDAQQAWEALELAKEQSAVAGAKLDEFACRVARILGVETIATGNAIERARAAADRIRALDESIERHAHENARLRELACKGDESVAAAETSLQRAEAAWKEAHSGHFSSAAMPSDPKSWLGALGEIAAQVKEFRRLEAALAGQEKELETVAIAISPLLAALGMGDLGASGLPKLLDLWTRAEEDAVKRREHLVVLEGKRTLAHEVKEQVALLQRDLEALIAESGSIDEDEFVLRLGLWESTAQERASLRTCKERIALHDDETRTMANSRSHAQWTQERDALLQEIEAAKEGMDERSRKIGGLKHELQAKDAGNEAALEARLNLARRTTELNDQARSHLRNSLAKIAVERARDAYCRSHTPQLQSWAGDYLSTMTGGTWTTIDLTDESSLHISSEKGGSLGEHALSTGTADQVRLAIRMAVARQWAQAHEPLPFLLDDVLVHSDGERMPRAMDALLEVSRYTQVIYFTCHESVKKWGQTHGATVISVA